MGGGGAPHGVAALAVLRGVGASAVKSVALASVSAQPASPRSAGGRVADRRRGTAAFEVDGPAVPDEVGDRRDGRAAPGSARRSQRRRVAHDRDLATGDGEVRRARRVGGRQRRTDGGGRRELHEVVAAGRDRAGQGRGLPARAGRRRRTGSSSRSTSIVVEPRLKSSTKSFAKGAPALPPPAKTWLTTTSGDALLALGTASTPPAREATENDEDYDSRHGALRSARKRDSSLDTVLSVQAKGSPRDWHTLGTHSSQRRFLAAGRSYACRSWSC